MFVVDLQTQSLMCTVFFVLNTTRKFHFTDILRITTAVFQIFPIPTQGFQFLNSDSDFDYGVLVFSSPTADFNSEFSVPSLPTPESGSAVPVLLFSSPEFKIFRL